jgi:hypothetical protein
MPLTRRQAPVDHFAANEGRFNAARETHGQIGDFAFGHGSRGTVLEAGAVHRLGEAMASEADEEDYGFAGVPPSAFAVTPGGSSEPMSKGEVLRHWEIPPNGPANQGVFMGASSERQRRKKFDERGAQIDAFHTQAGTPTSTMEHGGDVMGQAIDNRLAHLHPDRDPYWYGAEGRAPQMIRDAAQETGLRASQMRRGVAHFSPQMLWDKELKSGPRKGQTVYPNLEASVQMAKEIAVVNPQTAEEAVAAGREIKISQAATADMKGKGARALSGHEDPSKTIESDLHKVKSFDVALGDPNHQDSTAHVFAQSPGRGASWAEGLRSGGFGLSPMVARHVMDTHVGDTHDADALGIKESMVQHPTEKNNNGKPTKYGVVSGLKNKPFQATFLEKPSGYDFAVATNTVASAEAFRRDYAEQHASGGKDAADAWARSNAIRYTVAASQSSQWSDRRDDNPRGRGKKRA